MTAVADPLTVKLAYGRTGLSVTLPGRRSTMVSPQHPPAPTNPRRTLVDALRAPVAGPPLRTLVRPGQAVAIAVCDSTRPQPREPMLSVLLDELAGAVADEDITVLVATGTHRASTPEERRAMFGAEILARVRVVDHDSRDDASLVWCGRHGANVPVWLNRTWVEADVRITTGFVEPHFFAGFSGGPKMVAPGLAGLETVLTMHNATRIGDPAATWGICEGNPVHDDVRAIAAATGVDFGFDVVLDGAQRVVAAFGGELFAMHAAARELVRRTAMRPVPQRFDVVVTTNAGYPLDRNLYQAVKGMSAAATVVKPGGTIVCAAECRDGFPDHGSFRQVLASAPSPTALLELIGARQRTVPDQWQVQVLAKVLAAAKVHVHTSYLSDDDLRGAHLLPCADVSDTAIQALDLAGPGARLCVLPHGPMTIPYVAVAA